MKLNNKILSIMLLGATALQVSVSQVVWMSLTNMK